MIWLALVLLGVVAGAVSGMIGLGGGVIVVPALVLLFGFSQKLAQGTTLVLLPGTLVAAYLYWRHGLVDLHAAGFIIIGFLVGGFLGARYALHVSDTTVTRIFAVFLMLVAVRMLLGTKV